MVHDCRKWTKGHKIKNELKRIEQKTRQKIEVKFITWLWGWPIIASSGQPCLAMIGLRGSLMLQRDRTLRVIAGSSNSNNDRDDFWMSS